MAPWADRIAIGDTRRYEIKAFRADGLLERIVRRDHVPRGPTPADVEAEIEARVERNTRGAGSDSEGQVLGFFETPADWLIYEIGEDHVLVWTQDELGVETVQVWPLERSEGQ